MKLTDNLETNKVSRKEKIKIIVKINNDIQTGVRGLYSLFNSNAGL